MGGDFALLQERTRKIAGTLASTRDGEDVLIVSHLDADGLSAGTIMLQALLRAGASPTIRIVKQLDLEAVDGISSSRSRVVVLTDLGSGQKSMLQNVKGKVIVVIDHHQPEDLETDLLEFNPHLSGFDGSTEISASGTAFLIARAMDPANFSLVNLALVGAFGDLQDKGKQSTLTGLNAAMAEEACSAGILEVKKGLKLYGFESRPLIKCMEYSLDPYLPGLSGDEGACFKFIKGLGVDPRLPNGTWKSVADLSKDELKTVVNGLMTYLISQGLTSKEAESIVGAIYIFTNELQDSPLRDVREFSSSINACGRLGRFGLGISICMGDRDKALSELKDVIQSYKKAISGYLDWLEKNQGTATRVLTHVQALFGGTQIDEKMIGTIISIAISSKPFSQDRPIIGFANSASVVKVSARGTAELVKRGLDLGKVMKEAATQVGGAGGGHNIAAGAEIPSGKESEFLALADGLIFRSMEAQQSEIQN
jgi:RecJ-like exonuclease